MGLAIVDTNDAVQVHYHAVVSTTIRRASIHDTGVCPAARVERASEQN